MADILIMGEILVEIMRDREDVQLYEQGCFRGPFPSGAPAICASAAARLGSKVALVGGVGKDDFGKCITERLEQDGVDTSWITVTPKVSTGCAFVTYFGDGSRKFIYHMGNSAAVETEIPENFPYQDLKYMHIMGCSLMAQKEFAEKILAVMRKAVSAGAKVSFDPNIRKELLTDDSIHAVIGEVMENTSIFLPGREELLSITGADTVEKALEACFAREKMEMVLLKNGSKGSTLYLPGGEAQEFGVYKVKQEDATGAGDCFDGAFLSALVQGKSVKTAARWAAAAGALNAAAFGPMEGNINLETVTKMIEG